jgi:hypothetical protein
MFKITIRKDSIFYVELNSPNIIHYICTTLQDNNLAIRFVGRLDLSSTENLYAVKYLSMN